MTQHSAFLMFLLFFSLPVVRQAFGNTLDLIRQKGIRTLEPGKLIKRQAAGGHRHKIRKMRGPAHYQVAMLNELAISYPEVTMSIGKLDAFYGLKARLQVAKGNFAQAITFQSRANALSERNLALNLAAGSERRKLAYLAIFAKETDFTLSLHSQVAPSDPLALDLAFTTLLRRKGRGLEAMTDTIARLRRRAAPQDQELFERLAEARAQLAAFTLGETRAVSSATYLARFKLLEAEVERLEAELSSHSAEFRMQTQPITLAAVRGALPAGSALIEFAVFRPQNPRTRKSKPPRYLAYLLPAQGSPGWVDLGEAALIDSAVRGWRKALCDPDRHDVKRLARAADERIMRPVRSLLGDTRRLLISPDGLLNLIPFAALVDEEKRYLVERYSISYLTSGRDLLRLQVPRESKSGPLVIAAPDFGRRSPVDSEYLSEQLAEKRESIDFDFSGFYYPPLPYAAREGEELLELLPGATLLTKQQATKAALRQIRSPALLHIATHGFFLDDLKLTLPRLVTGGIRIENPLLRSGLVLAGANEHKKDDNGILTALEVAGLDLWGTKMAVLSACDTGVGEVKNGDGVHGLRRALVLAGAETQVMSLWAVSDKATRYLMVAYYRMLQQGEGRGEALRHVQLEMLKNTNRQHPHYWASFIQSGEWRTVGSRQWAP
jgi:CHAT domain-containing protein